MATLLDYSLQGEKTLSGPGQRFRVLQRRAKLAAMWLVMPSLAITVVFYLVLMPVGIVLTVLLAWPSGLLMWLLDRKERRLVLKCLAEGTCPFCDAKPMSPDDCLWRCGRCGAVLNSSGKVVKDGRRLG